MNYWRKELAQWEADEVRFSEVYAESFGHKHPGASQMLLIARLAALLDEQTRLLDEQIEANKDLQTKIEEYERPVRHIAPREI